VLLTQGELELGGGEKQRIATGGGGKESAKQLESVGAENGFLLTM